MINCPGCGTSGEFTTGGWECRPGPHGPQTMWCRGCDEANTPVKLEECIGCGGSERLIPNLSVPVQDPKESWKQNWYGVCGTCFHTAIKAGLRSPDATMAALAKMGDPDAV